MSDDTGKGTRGVLAIALILLNLVYGFVKATRLFD